MGYGITQTVSIEVVFDHLFATPARGAAGEVGLAVAIGIEQFGDLRVLELADILDAMCIRGFFVDQVTL